MNQGIEVPFDKGKYEIVREIGRGSEGKLLRPQSSIGCVYEAKDKELGIHVALKIARSSIFRQNPLKNEIEVLENLQKKFSFCNLYAYYTQDTEKEDCPPQNYISMELLGKKMFPRGGTILREHADANFLVGINMSALFSYFAMSRLPQRSAIKFLVPIWLTHLRRCKCSKRFSSSTSTDGSTMTLSQ